MNSEPNETRSTFVRRYFDEERSLHGHVDNDYRHLMSLVK